METTFHYELRSRLTEFTQYSEIQRLAYAIVAQQQEKRFNSLSVLSFFPEEGKTLVCAALAMAYANICRTKVLIVDTSTFHNERSLVLKECMNGTSPLVEVTSLKELKKTTSTVVPPASAQSANEQTPVLHAEIVMARSHPPAAIENDFSLIKKVADDRSSSYGLVLLDTAALEVKNKNNVDPMLVARLSAASVLVVSRILLDVPNLNAILKELKEDPSLHLLGVIANEGHGR